ncbi:MAG: class I SAM-dependent methyltransferase [Planctomycetota bacterium]
MAEITCTPFQSRVAPDDMLFAKPVHWGIVEHAPAQMLPRERLLLYSAVFAFAPARALEIGVAQGGSTRIIHAALSDLNHGKLVSLDPMPDAALDWSETAERATLLIGGSPDFLATAKEVAGGPFDFVFVDGDHSEEGVHRDLVGLLDVTEPGAQILLHDAYFPPVAAGIDRALRESRAFRDAGMVSRTPHDGMEGEIPLRWGGLRQLVRVAVPRRRWYSQLWRRHAD